MNQELTSRVAARLYVIVLIFVAPLIAANTYIFFTKNDSDALLIVLMFTAITLPLLLQFAFMKIEIINNTLRYRSLFRSFNININELLSFGVKTIYKIHMKQLPTGKPIFIYKTKNKEEFTFPVNMFDENSFKKISKYLISKNIDTFHDNKSLSKRMVKRYYE